ncbi:MAG TPA: hypothetical protein VMD09_03455 [Solirubrobacteraceae bacterium]|nr:hypothetical protein [Solirubrobacteraceae bacterium]
MSVLAFAVINAVLAAVVVAAILRLHVWAILTGHRDHVRAAQVAPVIGADDRPTKVPDEGVAIAV